MDPKQKSPLGGTPAGGQEGQNPSSASAGANSGAAPVFSSGTTSAPVPDTTTDSQKMPGTLGAENLSTGANVSRTMDSLNSKNQSETGTSVFSKHKFDRAEPDGSILIPESKGLFFRKSKGGKDSDVTGSMIAARGESVDGLDPETRRKRRMLRIGGIVGASLAVILAIVIVVVLVVAPRPEKAKTIDTVAVAEFINNNQDDNLYNMEKLFARMYAGNYTIYDIYGENEHSLLEKYTPALQTLTTIYNELMVYSSGYSPKELADRFKNLAGFIKNRQGIYTEALETIDNFYAVVTNQPEGSRAIALKYLQELNNPKIQDIINKVQSELTNSDVAYNKYKEQGCPGLLSPTKNCLNLYNEYEKSKEYISGPQLVTDILVSISEPINYEGESFIFYNLDTLVVDLKKGGTTVTEVLNPIRGELITNMEITQNER